jgi:hypothetical protein
VHVHVWYAAYALAPAHDTYCRFRCHHGRHHPAGFRLSHWLETGARVVNDQQLASKLSVPAMAVVGDMDYLLPSEEEAARLGGAVGADRWRGTVVVQGAGHASTLGNRIDLCASIREAFAEEFTPALVPVDLVTRAEHPGSDGAGWDRGMLDRTFPSLDPTEYTRWSRGGDQYPGADAAVAPTRSAELPEWLKMLKP